MEVPVASKLDPLLTLDSDRLRVRGDAGQVLRAAGEVGVVLRPEVVDPQDGLEVADLGDGDAARPRRRPRPPGSLPQGLPLSKPGERQREVPVRDGAQHGHPLAQAERVPHRKLVQRRRNYTW